MRSPTLRLVEELYLYDLLYRSPPSIPVLPLPVGGVEASIHLPAKAGVDRLVRSIDLLSTLHRPPSIQMGKGWAPATRLVSREPTPFLLLDRLLFRLLPTIRRKELLTTSSFQPGGWWVLVLREVAELNLPTRCDLFGWPVPVRLSLHLPHLPPHLFRLYYEVSTEER